MAKKPSKRLRRDGGQKRTDADRSAGPNKPTPAALRDDFERRKRQQLAKAAVDLDHVDAEILRQMLTHPAITHAQIADLLGLPRRQTVTERVNASKFKRALEIANRTALEIFEANKARAARVLGELLGSPDDRIKIRAAIAHMWPHIHAGEKGTGTEDFVTFIQEAFEQAEANKAAAGGGKTKA